MFTYCLPKLRVAGQARLPECLQVESDEPLPLLVGDLQIATRNPPCKVERHRRTVDAAIATSTVRRCCRGCPACGQVGDRLEPADRILSQQDAGDLALRGSEVGEPEPQPLGDRLFRTGCRGSGRWHRVSEN